MTDTAQFYTSQPILPRIVEHMPAAEYQAYDAISNSGLGLINRSPLHYWAERINQDDGLRRVETRALEVGTAFHLLALEPDAFLKRVAVGPDVNLSTKIGKAEWSAFQRESAGLIQLRPTEMDGLSEMAKAIRRDAGARFLLIGNGRVECSMFWEDRIHPVECKGRCDWLRDDGLIIDIKTTENANPIQFDKSAWNYRYYVQAAFYMDGYEEIMGKPPEGFVFIAVEKKPPYAVSLHLIEYDSDYHLTGRLAYIGNMERYAECRALNKWPGYSAKIRHLTPPAWAKY